MSITMPLYLFVLIAFFVIKTGDYFVEKYILSDNRYLYNTSKAKDHVKSVAFFVAYSNMCFLSVVMVGNLIS